MYASLTYWVLSTFKILETAGSQTRNQLYREANDIS
jgi:hypothetical protein